MNLHAMPNGYRNLAEAQDVADAIGERYEGLTRIAADKPSVEKTHQQAFKL